MKTNTTSKNRVAFVGIKLPAELRKKIDAFLKSKRELTVSRLFRLGVAEYMERHNGNRD